MARMNQRGIAHIQLLVILVLALGVIGFVGYKVASYKVKPSISSNTNIKASSVTTSLDIESTPSGISMSGKPICDSSTLHNVTPYTCTKNNNSIDTVITAPKQVVLSGKTYNFVTWSGCSASNIDKAICKVVVDEGKKGTLEASYAVLNSKSNSKSSQVSTHVATNDTSCTVSIISGVSFGVGSGMAIGSSNNQDSVCTFYERNPPPAGYKVNYSVAYNNIISESCGTNCAYYNQYNMSSYYNWFSIDDLSCQYLIASNTKCNLYTRLNYKDTGTIYTQPASFNVTALQVYDEYYSKQNIGCVNYYCQTKSTFENWNMSVQPGNSITPSIINVVANYKIDIIYDPAYVSSLNNQNSTISGYTIEKALENSFPSYKGPQS